MTTAAGALQPAHEPDRDGDAVVAPALVPVPPPAPLPAPRRPGAVRIAATFATWMTTGLVLGLALAMSAPTLAGYRSLTILSGSMEPALHVGSVVLSEAVPASKAHLGEIITYADPARKGELVSHRLMRASVSGGVAHMVTRGDANGASEEWSVPATGTIGVVRYQIPLLGYVKAQLDAGLVRFGLLGMVAISGLLVLLEIWRPKRQLPPDR